MSFAALRHASLSPGAFRAAAFADSMTAKRTAAAAAAAADAWAVAHRSAGVGWALFIAFEVLVHFSLQYLVCLCCFFSSAATAPSAAPSSTAAGAAAAVVTA